MTNKSLKSKHIILLNYFRFSLKNSFKTKLTQEIENVTEFEEAYSFSSLTGKWSLFRTTWHSLILNSSFKISLISASK